jgi:hypothetical protein
MRRTNDHKTAANVAQIVAEPIATLPPPTAQPILDDFGARTAVTDVAVTTAQLEEADKAVNGPAARSTGLDGAGIKIGIISDSFDLSGTASADERSGLLPSSGVTVLEEGPSGGTDEGRAMAELLHATAPDAQLYFYSGFFSETDMAAGIAALRAAGCQIIVDDISYADEPMFQVAGPIDTAVQAAISAGVDYFTAVGNDGTAAYEASVDPKLVQIAGLGGVWAQTFAGGATTQSVTIPGGFTTTLSLQWDAPFDANNADTITVKILSGSTVLATSTQSDTEPVVTVDFPLSFVTRTYSIAILYSSGSGQPSLLKYVLEGGGTINDPAGGENTGTAYGHTLVPGVNAVGAVNVANTPSQGGTPTPESFSSTGGSQLLFSSSGAVLASPQATSAPDYLAPDGAGTSVFNPFDGTSAAAPVAAATAALMLQADRTLSTGDLTTLLEDSALPVASSDGAAGVGLIQANLATNFARTNVIAGSPQTVIFGISQACTIQGGAGNHWLVAGSGATLIQSQGTDSVQAGAGADTVDLSGAAAALYGSSGATWVRTLGGNDTVAGGSGALTVSGGAGGGVIYGGTGGGDQLFAGDQATTILSEGTGDLVGGVGNGDLLYASNFGQDTIAGGAGTEILVGGIGSTAANAGADVFVAGNGTPLIAPEASSAVVTLGTSDGTVVLGSGMTVLQVTNGQAGGADWIYNFDPTQDLLLLNGFGNELTAAQASIGNQYDVGGDSWVKLPDGTVLAFVGLSHLSATNVSYG